MENWLPFALIGSAIASITLTGQSAKPVWAEQSLLVAYPPANHETTADKIFLIGTAPPHGTVLVNGKPIQRSAAGHFAPSFPLQVGENLFKLQYQSQALQLKVIRKSVAPVMPTGITFGKDSLTPAVDMARLPGEFLCFEAIAPSHATVSLKLGNQVIPLPPKLQGVELPSNSAILTQQNQPTAQSIPGHYQGCAKAIAPGELGQPQFQLMAESKTVSQSAQGNVTILEPAKLQVAEVTADSSVARTGPNSDYSRMTPLPKGTRANVSGREGDWLRLDYGGWIKNQDVKILETAVPVRSRIRSVTSRQVADWTEIVFPLEVPVPMTVQQGDNTFTLTLHNTTAQTDTIKLNDDPLIARLDWQQVAPTQVQYVFVLKSKQQWGYKLRYDGTSLILSLRHPPKLSQGVTLKPRIGIAENPGLFGSDLASPHLAVGLDVAIAKPLSGTTILIDPGHGSQNDLGAKGPTGYPEKDAALTTAKLLQAELESRGATVIMTRVGDEDLLPQDRAAMITKIEPTLALSLHYNALPDSGDALHTQGLAAFWYNTQAHSLAVFLHNYLVEKLKRPSYGIFWNNLALTRPTVAPSVLLELGFMINPEEFEWIVNPQEQQKLAVAIAQGVTEWVRKDSVP
jgi:N-acetylmuramoyl-L-alanine amidase